MGSNPCMFSSIVPYNLHTIPSFPNVLHINYEIFLPLIMFIPSSNLISLLFNCTPYFYNIPAFVLANVAISYLIEPLNNEITL
jgi:hypothetical protein